MPSKIIQAKARVFIFSARASSGFVTVPKRDFQFLPAYGVQSVPIGVMTVTIAHRLNTDGLGYMFLPNWSTTLRWISMLPDSVTIGFGSQAPHDAQVFWGAKVMPFQDVTQNMQYAVINHNLGSLTTPIFVTANWNTTIFDSTPDRTPNSATVYFGSAAHGTTPQIMYWAGI